MKYILFLALVMGGAAYYAHENDLTISIEKKEKSFVETVSDSAKSNIDKVANDISGEEPEPGFFESIGNSIKSLVD